MSRALLCRTLTVVAIIMATAIPGRAQVLATFRELPLRLDLGDTVTVLDLRGTRVRGRVLSLTPDQIVVGDSAPGVAFTSDRVRQVERCCDSIKNGTLIGALTLGAIGFASGLHFAGRTEVGDGLFLGLVFGGLGAGLGAGADALIARDVVVYRARPPISFRADPRRRAVVVTFGF
jgi:hypothetical protein